MRELLDKSYEIRDRLEHHAYNLRQLGNAFVHTGNREAGNHMHLVAEDLVKMGAELQDAVSGELNGQLKQSREVTAGILEAALAGITLGSAQPKKES